MTIPIAKERVKNKTKNPPGLRWAGALKALLRYFFAVRLRVEGARGVLTRFEVLASDVVPDPSDADPAEGTSAMASCGAGSVTGRLDTGLNPLRTSAKRLAPANAQAFMASACAPIIRRTAPADSRT